MNELVKVTARRRPFLPDFQTLQVPEGTTIAAVVAALYPHAKIRALAVAFLDGVPVPPESWGVAPRAGQLLNVSLVPQDALGLGSDTLRIALSTVISFGAYAASRLIKGPLGWAISAVGFVASAILGNWLIPASETTLDQTGYSLSGTRNTITQYGCIPKIYGRVRVVPPMGALPYTETLGEDQYIRALFVLGYGPLTVRDLRIGDVQILVIPGQTVEYSNVQVEVLEGLPDDPEITLVTESVVEEAIDQKLTYGMEPVTRVTATDADEIAVELAFPDGLCNKKNDKIEGWSVYIRIRYRPHGAGDDAWIEVDEAQAQQLSDLAAMTNTTQIAAWLDSLTDGLTQAAADILALDPGDWTATEETSTRLLDWLDTATHAIANAKNPQNNETLFEAIEDCANAIAAIAPLVGGVVIAPIEGVAAAAKAITDVLALILDGIKILVDVNDCVARGYGNALSTYPMLERWWIQLRGLTEYFPEITVDEARITGSTVKPMRRGYRWQVTRGCYDVWIDKTQPDVDTGEYPDVIEEMHWSLLRSVRNRRPIALESLPPLALVAIRIKASDQFTGSLDQVNCEVTARLPVAYPAESGYDWVVEETRNPAWAWLDALCGPNRPGLTEIPLCHVPRPVTLDRIENLDDVYEWATACDTEEFRVGDEPIRVGRTFDCVFTRQITQDALCKAIAAAGQASHGRPGGKFGIVRDILLTVPDQHFTPANSWGFGAVVKHAKLPNALRVQFNDADQNYKQTERIAYDDNYGPVTDGAITAAETYETIELVGCTDARQAWCDGRYYLAQMKLRPRRFTLNSMADWLTCRRGGLVRVTHDVPMWGLAWGRVRSVGLLMTEDDPPVPVDPPVTIVVVDNSIPMEAGHTYNLVMVYSDGYGYEVELNPVMVDGEYYEVSFNGELPLSPATDTSAGGVAAAAADMWMAGQQGYVTHDLKVVDISCGKDMTATLSLVDAAPEIHRDPNLPIPAFDPGTFVPPVLEIPRPAPPQIAVYAPGQGRAGQLMIFADERACIVNPDGSLTPTIIVHLVAQTYQPGDIVPDSLDVQYQRQADPGHEESPNMMFWVGLAPLPIETLQVQIFGLSEGHTYNLRLRYACRSGLCSKWATATVYLSGKLTPPPDVPSVMLENGRILRWSYPSDIRPIDFKGFLVRHYPGIVAADQWFQATPLGDGFQTDTFVDVGLFTGGERTFFVKAIDTSGNESDNAAIVQTNIAGATPQNVIYSNDITTLGTPQELRGGEWEDDQIKALADTTGEGLPMYPAPWSDPMYPDPQENAFYDQGWQNIDFSWGFTPPAGTEGCTMTVAVEADYAEGVELFYSDSGVDYQRWPGQLIAHEGVKVYFHLLVTAPAIGEDRPIITAIANLVDVPDITEHFEDLAISDAAAGIRLPIVQTYHQILGVGGLTMQQDAHGAVVLKVVDKGTPSAIEPTDGPLIKAYNAAGATVQVDAFDATVWGF